MNRIAFADESGTHANTPCYGIGVVSFDEEALAGFEAHWAQLKTVHNVQGELKWTGIGNRFSDINLVLDWLDAMRRSQTGHFDVIIVNTALYNKWSQRDANREDAFYITYTHVLKHVVERSQKSTRVLIDERSDSYPRQHEAMEIVGNHMLSQLSRQFRLENVERRRSHDTPGIQVADVLTGLFVAGHTARLRPDAPLNRGKRLAVERAASMLGWDNLCHDTMPGSKLNVWHFPSEYRNDPSTQRIMTSGPVPYVTREDLK